MKKILIVDDDEIIRNLCQRILIKEGYIVQTAKNAKEALEIIDNTFNFVITDLEMPDFDGLWLTKEIKHNFKEKIPVILMSGFLDDDEIIRAKDSGVSAFLLKPFDINDLLRLVSRHLGGF